MEPRSARGDQPIAVVGVSTLFPGSQDVAGFWADIVNGKNLIIDVPPTHWLVEDYYDPTPGKEGKVYAKTGAFLQDIDFDPMVFGIPPKLLTSIDTVQLLALLAAQRLLDSLPGIQKQLLDRSKTSVILGVAAGTELISEMVAKIQYPIWVKVLREKGLPEDQVQDICRSISGHYVPWDENTFPGLLANVVAGRIANRLDLGGTNCTVDAACASSLAAVSMAVQELRLGRTDLAITGGCDALNDIFMYMCFSQTYALSRSGDCRPFSDQADGTVMGEGIGLLALRRLEDAQRDGDPILALLHGIGSASDGKAKSIYAPVAGGQALAIKRAYETSPYTLKDVELIEAHGTGTAAGDMAEFEGLQLAFESMGAGQKPYCALGSIKSQIGHTKSAAGAAGLIKAVLSLHHKVLPPTIKITRPNPSLPLHQSPFYLNTQARPWIHDPETTRKAGVSAFGFGGSNFHITVEEYQGQQADRCYMSSLSLVLLSADHRSDLEAQLTQVLQDLDQFTLPYLAKTSQLNFNSQHHLRLSLLVSDQISGRALVQECLEKLKAQDSGVFSLPARAYFQQGAANPKVALLFPGQGSQYPGMTKDLCIAFEAARRVWDQSLADRDSSSETTLPEVVFPVPAFNDQDRGTQEEKLKQPQWAQPALGAASLCYWSMLRLLELKPDAVAGHSYGELPALFAAGVIPTAASLLAISRKRGQLMQASARAGGGMTAILAGLSTVEQLLAGHHPDLTIANVNSPRQVVVSGPVAALESLEKKMTAEAVRFKRLAVAAAFHSPALESLVPEFEDYLKTQDFKPRTCVVYANTTAGPYPDHAAQEQHLLASQLSRPVQFEQQIKALHSQDKIEVFVECGPGKVLSGLTSECLAGQPHLAVSLDGGRSEKGVDAFWTALAQLAAAGVKLNYAPLWKKVAITRALAKPSKTTVKINGANVGKHYPPRGGAAALPPPNPKSQPAAAAPAPPAEQPQAASLEAMQKNILAAQESFQNTLKQSHLAFLKTTESMLGHLTGRQDFVTDMTARPFPSEPLKPSAPETATPLPVPTMAEIQPAPPSQPVPTAAEPQGRSIDIKAVVLQVVSEKTGYPEEMLALDQDLESGLGIDSIKRVEIVSALQAALPALNAAAPEDLAGMRTLGQIITYLEQHQAAPAPQAQAAQARVPAVNAKAVVLQVVSEKTGYPEEMLGLDQDLESGLGIDSIKRVEIVSALQAALPALNAAAPEDLAGMRTLGQILDYIGGKAVVQASAPAVASSESPVAANHHDVVLERYIIITQAAKPVGLGLDHLEPGQFLWLVADNRGVAPALQRLLDGAGLHAQVVAKPPLEADAVIYLKGLNQLESPDPIAEAGSLNKEAFQLARQMVKASSPRLLVVVHDTQPGPGQAVLQGLGALAATAAWEWPDAALKSIGLNLQALEPGAAAQCLFQELLEGGPALEARWDGVQQRVVEAAVPAGKSAQPRSLKDKDVVVVSGGARGVTAACLLALAKEVKVRMALLGRTALREEPAFISECTTEAALKQALAQRPKETGAAWSALELEKATRAVLANREVQQTLATLRALGVEAAYYQVDIRNRAEVAACLKAVRTQWGAINAVIHAAGVVADKTIADKSDEQFDRVFDTKVTGWRHLLEAVKDDELSHLCCFTSIAGRWGNAGQVDYAMANRVLNALCQWEKARRKDQCVVKALDWGPWEGGMVSPALQAHFQKQGLALIPLESGARAFVEELSDPDPQAVEVMIGAAMGSWKKRAAQHQAAWSVWLQAEHQPLLLDHVINQRPVVPMMLVVEWCARAAASLQPGQALISVEQLKVLKGLRPDHFQTQGAWIRLICQQQPDAAGALRFALEDQSQRRVYELALQMDKHTPPAPTYNCLQELNPWSFPAGNLYGDKLFHGPGFQVIQKLVDVGPAGATALLKQEQPLPDPGPWQTPVAMLDGGLQVGSLVLHHHTGVLQLPLGFERLQFYGPQQLWDTCRCEVRIHQAGEQQGDLSIAYCRPDGSLMAMMDHIRFFAYHKKVGLKV